MMYIATVGPDGLITIPAEVRDDLGLKAGDQILFIKDEDKDYIFRLVTGSIMDLKGCVCWTGKLVTIEEMNETIRKGWAGELTFED